MPCIKLVSKHIKYSRSSPNNLVYSDFEISGEFHFKLCWCSLYKNDCSSQNCCCSSCCCCRFLFDLVFVFLWEKLREIISDNVADCVSTRNVFEKQENKKVKHTQHTKRGETIQKLWSDFIFVCARRTASSVGAHYVSCLKVLYEIPFREALALLLAHTEASVKGVTKRQPLFWQATSHPQPKNSPPHTDRHSEDFFSGTLWRKRIKKFITINKLEKILNISTENWISQNFKSENF